MLDLDTCEGFIRSFGNRLICVADSESILGTGESRIDEAFDILIIISLRFEGEILR